MNEKYVLSRDGLLKGELTGGSRRCQMEGCTGRRLRVKWPDGSCTWPCTKGMDMVDEETYQII